jgi:hypothetical protein
MIKLSRLSEVIFYLASSVVLFFLVSCNAELPESRQAHIHQMGHNVMPFDLNMTTHIFKMTETGGIQRVIAKDRSDANQIMLIQQHLHHEAELFQKGDYSDPATLHGEDMPGLKELHEGAARVTVTYAPLPAGAEITFSTNDPLLLTAIHQWFGAQLSEHGADATYK